MLRSYFLGPRRHLQNVCLTQDIQGGQPQMLAQELAPLRSAYAVDATDGLHLDQIQDQILAVPDTCTINMWLSVLVYIRGRTWPIFSRAGGMSESTISALQFKLYQ